MTIGQRISRCVIPPALLFALLVAYRYVMVRPAADRIQPAKVEPWVIAPRFNEPRVATDEQLIAVMNRVTPPTAQEQMTNNWVHALRLWGPKADFHSDKLPTGEELRQYFLDDKVFRKYAGDKAPPLFYYGRDGLDVRSFDDRPTDRASSSYHVDDLLATFAETGTSLDTPILLRDKDGQPDQATVGELLNASMQRFHLERFEYEWTAIVYARYVFPQRQWKNKFGSRIDTNMLVKELIDKPLDIGPCNGLHRLEALVVLYRANEEANALQPRTKQSILRHMKGCSDLLVSAQHPEGYWTRSWPKGPGSQQDTKASLHDKLLVTGHQLEWLAYAPEEVQPPRETIVRAGQWLCRTLTEMDEKDLRDAYGPYTHAARALCLWRNLEPYAAWEMGQTPNKANGG